MRPEAAMDDPLLGAAATSSSTSRGPLSTLPLPTAAELPDSEPPATETRYAGRSGSEDEAEEEYDPDQSRYDEDLPLDGGRRFTGVIDIFGYRFRPATSFAFCFGLREAMLIFVGMQFLSGVFWLYVRAPPLRCCCVPRAGGVHQLSHLLITPVLAPQTLYRVPGEDKATGTPMLRAVSITLFLLNAVLGLVSVQRSSEWASLSLVGTFGLLLLMITIVFGTERPSECSVSEVVDSTPLGELVIKLLWTSDACVLMSVLGWVLLAAVAGLAIYFWYLSVCYYVELRARNEDVRRVRKAISSLPCRRFVMPPTPADGGESGNGGDEGPTCSICLGEFGEGEEVRLLPCMHEFCKDCIDSWILRQGIAASCPLCKRMLIPRRPARNGLAPSLAAQRATRRMIDRERAALVERGEETAAAANINTGFNFDERSYGRRDLANSSGSDDGSATPADASASGVDFLCGLRPVPNQGAQRLGPWPMHPDDEARWGQRPMHADDEAHRGQRPMHPDDEAQRACTTQDEAADDDAREEVDARSFTLDPLSAALPVEESKSSATA